MGYLVASIVLGLVHILAAAAASTAQRGTKWNVGNRDATLPDLTGAAARLDRANNNFKETFPLLLASVAVVVFSAERNATTDLGLMLYFWARLIYLPLYGIGIPVVRSLAWLVSIVGIVTVLASAFL